MNSIPVVEKETIAALKFVKHEVLQTKEQISQRKADLNRAMMLGNIEHNKIRITFETEDGLKAVETTVWATTETEVSLKGGVSIPLSSIHRVDV